MENIICEKFLNDSPEPLSIKSIETILDQLKNSIRKIYNGKQGTGFFIKIPFNNIQLPVLITNNHIIDENDFINKKMITIYIGNEMIVHAATPKDGITTASMYMMPIITIRRIG